MQIGAAGLARTAAPALQPSCRLKKGPSILSKTGREARRSAARKDGLLKTMPSFVSRRSELQTPVRAAFSYRNGFCLAWA